MIAAERLLNILYMEEIKMIRYKFKVEVPFLDKTNNLKEVKKDA